MSIELRGRKIAIIGGAGFIGHNLALTLAARGARVEVIDSLQVNNLMSLTLSEHTPNRELYLRMINERLTLLNGAGVMLYPLDARDYHVLGRVLSDINPQVIIHLAAVSHAGRSDKDPFSTFDHSLRTLENALNCARDRAEQFIFLSSSMAYGDFMTDEIAEDHPLNPIGIYAALKVAGEKIVIAYQQVFKLPYTIVRPSALYGPRCVSRRVAQVFIEAAMHGEALRMAGDGTDRLDFTYIDDLVEGIALMIGNPAARNEIFNITFGQARSIRELRDLVRQRFPEVGVESVERDRLMPYRGTLSIAKASRLLGYRPQYQLETGLDKYINWYRTLMSSTSVPV